MGRSVNYLSRAEGITYFSGIFNDENDLWFEELEANVTSTLQSLFPSLINVEEWDGREVRIFLKNNFCEIGISEYCGLVSVSIRVRDDRDYQWLAENWIKKNWPKMVDEMSKNTYHNNLRKVGSFSNGEGIYELNK